MTILNVVGARPEFVQVCPLLRAIDRHNMKDHSPHINSILIHTGQHYDYDMSKIFFDELCIKRPDYHLNVGSGTHAYQTGEILKRLEAILMKERPDLVVVYGDTNSTFASALAAVKLHINVAHVEAGVRSFNKFMPEEVNRILTDRIADLYFCPSRTAIKNLANEGLNQNVYFVGDVMYDSILFNSKNAKKSKILEILRIKPATYAIATLHRAENTENLKRLKSIICALDQIAAEVVPVIMPIHPRTKQRLVDINIKLRKLCVIDPVSYLSMLRLEENSKIILTDSGGMQKEAFYLKVPCITLREETEWVETVDSGWNTLAGWSKKNIIDAAIQSTKTKHRPHMVYGDGHAAHKILSVILDKIH